MSVVAAMESDDKVDVAAVVANLIRELIPPTTDRGLNEAGDTLRSEILACALGVLKRALLTGSVDYAFLAMRGLGVVPARLVVPGAIEAAKAAQFTHG